MSLPQKKDKLRSNLQVLQPDPRLEVVTVGVSQPSPVSVSPDLHLVRSLPLTPQLVQICHRQSLHLLRGLVRDDTDGKLTNYLQTFCIEQQIHFIRLQI